MGNQLYLSDQKPMENSTTPNKNPLSKYFRQPAIYIKLPSNGEFWPTDSLELPLNRELAIYPMTTRDEITLRTPDALMNGSGVVDIIQSCVPEIKNAWLMPNIDVDAVLIAIRIASYGEGMDVETRCPHCNENNTHALNLQTCLASIQSPDYKEMVSIDSLKIKLKPSTYFGNNKAESIDFEQQKMLQALERADLPDDVRSTEIQKSMQRLVEISIDILVNSTDYVELEDGQRVQETEYIKEFYTNAPSTVIKTIQSKLEKFSVDGGIKPQIVNCSACTKPYEVPVIFNYSTFFGNGS